VTTDATGQGHGLRYCFATAISFVTPLIFQDLTMISPSAGSNNVITGLGSGATGIRAQSGSSNSGGHIITGNMFVGIQYEIIFVNRLYDQCTIVKNNFPPQYTESVNVKDFGAKGDGVTDDTAAIQAAHNSYQNIFYPSGDYVITSTIVLPLGAMITGEGALPAGNTSLNFTRIIATTSAYVFSFSAAIGTSSNGPRFREIHLYCQGE
jgi:hypothetical protein